MNAFVKRFAKSCIIGASLLLGSAAMAETEDVENRRGGWDGINSPRCQPANTCADWAGCLNSVVRVRPRINKVWEVDFYHSRFGSYLVCE
ncbi:MAG: hypothetical protein HRU19_19760 [Pseudobacteriovorax sp.]|nr:hypothetical protein [Pseudobacteriovorax sp.]